MCCVTSSRVENSINTWEVLISPEEKVLGHELALSECYFSCTAVGVSSHRLVWTKAKAGEQIFGAASSLLLWFNFCGQCALLLLFCSLWGRYNILARQARIKKHHYLSQLVAACSRGPKWACCARRCCVWGGMMQTVLLPSGTDFASLRPWLAQEKLLLANAVIGGQGAERDVEWVFPGSLAPAETP